MRKAKLVVLRGGAVGLCSNEVTLAICKRLGGRQQAVNYLAAVTARRRAMHDVVTGRRAAESLVAMPVWQAKT